MKSINKFTMFLLYIIATFNLHGQTTIDVEPAQDCFTAMGGWADPNTCYYTREYLQAGLQSPTEGRTYMKFTLPSLPEGATITSAVLYLKRIQYSSVNPTLGVYRIVNSWDQTGISFNSPPANWPSATVTFTTVSNNYVTLTGLVEDWYDGTYSNYGIMIAESTPSHYANFGSKENAEVTWHPKLTITYTQPFSVTNVNINVTPIDLRESSGDVIGNGTMTGNGSGEVAYVWKYTGPSGSYESLTETVQMTDGSANIPDYNFPDSPEGDYSVWLEITSPNSIQSNTEGYNVASTELTLYRVSLPDGTANSSNPGTILSTFYQGQTVRVTLKANNTGGSIPITTVLNIRNPSATTVYDSNLEGGNNTTDSPLNYNENDYYSFDWVIPAGSDLGDYKIAGSIRDPGNFNNMVFDETSDGPNTYLIGENAWKFGFSVVQAPDGVINYYALILGSGAWYYSRNSSQEQIVENDVNKVEEYLNNFGSNWESSRITKMINSQVSQTSIENSINTIGQNMDGDDAFLFYYSGHGSSDGLELFSADCLAPDELIGFINNNMPNDAKIILIINACNSGIFVNYLTNNNRNNTYAISSCKSNENTVIFSWILLHPWNSSLFCYHFCEGIDGGADSDLNQEVSSDEIFNYVNWRMSTGSISLSQPQSYYSSSSIRNIPITKEFSSSTTIPSIVLNSPDSDISISAGTILNITWGDSDSDDDAIISIARDIDDTEEPWAYGDHTWLAGDALIISENDPNDYYSWNTTGVSPGQYVIWAMIHDNNHAPRFSRSTGKVTVLEPSILLNIKIYLEGPYQAGGSMTTNLKTAGSVPLTSPYTDARTVTAVPDGVTDWVSVELRSSASGPAVVQRSFFLKSDGSIVETDGTTTDLMIPGVAAGDYFILVKHRNHLAIMSAAAQTLGSTSTSLYDFSTGIGQYYGTDTNRAKQVQTGVYGMVAGDANGSGTVDASDRSATWNGRNQSGYLNADCNLSGTVDASDRSITWNNRNRSTSVP